MDLSVIILSYNTKDITDECLKRVQGTGYRVQVIVLDNASTDGSSEMIKKKYPEVELIESKINTGYSKGNNIAFKRAKYPLVLFLNSDVYVSDDTLEKVLSYCENHKCDVLGVKLLNEDGSLQPSAGNLPNPINTIFWILGLGRLINPFHPKSKEYFLKDRMVGWTMGAFFLIKKEIFEKVGMFDESIFMYMDEVDLCKRIKDKGFNICFMSSVAVTHLHRASSKDFPEKAFSRELGGIKIYFKKYYSTSYFFVKLFLIFGLILRVIAFSLLGKTARAKAYMEGLKVI